MMEACELARQYNISECENSLLQQLRDQTVLNGNAISVILDKASSLSMPQLELLALEKCSCMLITPSAFAGFSPSALDLCLSAAHLKASETSILEAVICWGRSQLSNNPNRALKWVLADILPKLRLESIPADILQQMVHGLDLLSPEDIATVRFSQTVQEQPGLSRQYVRRPWGELGPDIACTDIDVIEFKSQQHQGARSRHCLEAGTGCYVWHLSVDRWLGNQKGCWMMGSNGSIAAAAPRCDCCADEFGCPLSPAEKVLYGNQSYHVVPYGAKYDANGTRVTVHTDMTARHCSFEVDGTHFGVAFWNLPAQVYPAVSMRYGGKVKFITCMGVS
ncbi:TPA: BTB/POZ domain-containing protein 19 [Trebouxia sp. C0005]